MNNIPLKLLMVEDNEDDAELVLLSLAGYGYKPDYKRVMSEEDFRSALQEQEWDVILSDYRMPVFDALQALNIFQEIKRDIPFIIVSGTIGEDVAVEALKFGANDYILKQNLSRLGLAVANEMRAVEERRMRRIAEEERRLSEERFREMAEHINEIFYILDVVNNKMLYISPAFERVSGKPVQMMYDDPLAYLQLIHPDDRHIAEEANARQEAGEITEIEYRAINAKGDILWIRDHTFPVFNREGNVERVVGIARNITERKRASLQLMRLNRSLKLLSSCNAALNRMTDEKALLQEVCDLAVNLGGYRMAWVGYLGVEKPDIVTPMVFAGVEDGYLSEVTISTKAVGDNEPGASGRALRDGKPAFIEDMETYPGYLRWRKEALQRGYKSTLSLPLLHEGNAFGFLILYTGEAGILKQDEIKLLEQLANNLAFGIANLRIRREHQEAFLRIGQQASLLDKAKDAIFVHDLENCITYWNKSAERLYGWSAEEVTGQKLPDSFYKLDTAFQKARDMVLKTGEWGGELLQQDRDGHELIVEASWTRVCNEDNLTSSIFCIHTDITAQKKLENQFLRAQRMESIGTLAGGIAHDLNNVLSPILMSSDLLKKMIKDPKATELLDSVANSARRGADMVGQVLSFARGMDGKRIEVQVRHLMLDVEKIIRDTFPKNITCRVDAGVGLRTITGDPTQLHQVLLNLCVNARDAMPDGGTIVIHAQNVVLDAQYAAMNLEANEGSYIVIDVEDSGTGIEPAHIEHIFEPFYTTKEMNKGTGLGLSTSLAIVKSHGGFIRVYSEMDKGSRFRVYLPAGESGEPEEEMPVPAENLAGKGETILVVDDEASIREITKVTLEDFGYKVLLAEDGAEAVTLYGEHMAEVAVVLVDMMMPVMDGLATIKVLARMNPEVRVIAVSGINHNSSIAKTADPSVKEFLSKPYTAEKLLVTLKAVLA